MAKQDEIAKVLEAYFGSLKSATHRSYKTAWDEYVKWLESTTWKDVSQANPDDVQKHVDKLATDGKSKSWVGVASSALKEIYRVLRLANLVNENPAREIKPPKNARHDPKTPALSEGEMRRLLDGLPGDTSTQRRNRAFLYLLHRTGWRSGEVAKLRVEDVVGRKVTGTIWARGEKKVTVDLTTPVIEAIEGWKACSNIEAGLLFPGPNGKPISRVQIGRIFQAAARRANLPDDKQNPEALRRGVKALGGAPHKEPRPELASGLETQSAPETSKLVDDQVVEALERLGSELACCYRQGIRDLLHADRTSYVGPAAELREVLTWVLHKLAPDEALKASDGWKAETKDGRPTRRQRSEFILKTKLKAKPGCRRTLEALTTGLDGLAGDLYERASKTTHTASGERDSLVTCTAYLNGLLRDLLL